MRAYVTKIANKIEYFSHGHVSMEVYIFAEDLMEATLKSFDLCNRLIEKLALLPGVEIRKIRVIRISEECENVIDNVCHREGNGIDEIVERVHAQTRKNISA